MALSAWFSVEKSLYHFSETISSKTSFSYVARLWMVWPDASISPSLLALYVQADGFLTWAILVTSLSLAKMIVNNIVRFFFKKVLFLGITHTKNQGLQKIPSVHKNKHPGLTCRSLKNPRAYLFREHQSNRSILWSVLGQPLANKTENPPSP